MDTRSRRSVRRLAAGLLVAGLLGVTVAVAPASAAATNRSWGSIPGRTVTWSTIRDVTSSDPLHVPPSDPLVLPSASCVRYLGGDRFEAVFGYVNVGPVSVYVPDDQLYEPNTVRRTRHGVTTTDPDGPQTTLFKPGVHPNEFAVPFRWGEIPSWHVLVPDPNPVYAWDVVVRPTFLSWCGPRVPKHFAVIQRSDADADDTDVVRDATGKKILSYAIKAIYDRTDTACSAGGTPITPDVIVGWNGDNLAVPDVIGHVVRGGHDYRQTRAQRAQVIDVHQPTVFAFPSTDVYGGCRFPDGSVVKAPTFWSDIPGAQGDFRITVGILGVEHVVGGFVAPGGTRYR